MNVITKIIDEKIKGKRSNKVLNVLHLLREEANNLFYLFVPYDKDYNILNNALTNLIDVLNKVEVVKDIEVDILGCSFCLTFTDFKDRRVGTIFDNETIWCFADLTGMEYEKIEKEQIINFLTKGEKKMNVQTLKEQVDEINEQSKLFYDLSYKILDKCEIIYNPVKYKLDNTFAGIMVSVQEIKIASIYISVSESPTYQCFNHIKQEVSYGDIRFETDMLVSLLEIKNTIEGMLT